MGWVTVDIEIDEFLSSCDKYDRMEIIKSLIADGYLPSELAQENGIYSMPGSRDDFNIALKKLLNRGWQLNKEEEEYIINLSKRFVEGPKALTLK